MNTNTTGGVSPLKAKKRQAHRGGPKAAKATSTSKRRGGFSESKGKRGAGGRNPGGYNVQTRFTPSVIAPFPGSGGTTTIDTSKNKKPYDYDKDGKLVMTEYKQDPDKKTPQRKSKGTFDEVWDANEDNFQDKWESKEDWEKQAQKEIDAGYYTETKTIKGKKYSRTYNVDAKGKRIEGSESEWKEISE